MSEAPQRHVGESTVQCIWEVARSLIGGGTGVQSVRKWELARISLERKAGARWEEVVPASEGMGTLSSG